MELFLTDGLIVLTLFFGALPRVCQPRRVRKAGHAATTYS